MLKSDKIIRKLSVCILIFLMLFSSFAVCADNVTAENNDTNLNAEISSEFELIDKNSSFELYLEKSELIIAVKDIKEGTVWYSSPKNRADIPGMTGAGGLASGSMLLVDYFDNSTQSAGSVNSLLGSVREKTAKYKKIKNGIRIDYDFSRKKEGFKIPIEIVLSDNGFKVRILFSEIEEYSEVLITNISVLPYFGTGTVEDDGYIIIPDGSGAVVNFNTGRNGMSEFSADVYGRDMVLTTVKKTTVSEDVKLPVFAIKKNDNAFCAWVTEGAGSATIIASPSGINGPLNFAYSKFTYRKTDNIVLADATWTPKDVVFIARSVSKRKYVETEYALLKKDKSDYIGIAEAYRNHLIADMGLDSKLNEGIRNYASFYGAVKKQKYFLGIPYTSIETLTTFAEAQSIAKQLNENGINNITYQFKGVLKGGMDGQIPIKANFESKLGGNSGWKSLIKDAEKNGYSVIPDVEFLYLYKSKFGWWSFNIGAKNINRSLLRNKIFKTSTFYENTEQDNAFMLSPDKLNTAVNKFLNSFAKTDTMGISISSLGNTVYSDFNTSHIYDEDASIDEYIKALNAAKKSLGTVTTAGGNEYAAVIADSITDAPISDSGYEITSHRIPFYQMVFSGYLDMASPPLNNSSNYTDSFLLCIETATSPNFAFTYNNTSELGGTNYEKLINTEFALWKDTAVKAYTQYNELFGNIKNKAIADYEIISDTLRIVTYSDGTAVLVNYSESDITYNENIIPSKGFIAIKG